MSFINSNILFDSIVNIVENILWDNEYRLSDGYGHYEGNVAHKKGTAVNDIAKQIVAATISILLQ